MKSISFFDFEINPDSKQIQDIGAIYANEKKDAREEWPKYICADALDLDKHLDIALKFELITCMMGTFEHISRKMQEELVIKLYNRLTAGGVCLISVWDTECPHLAYLTMYDENQKQLIRQNSSTQSEMQKMFFKGHKKSISLRIRLYDISYSKEKAPQ